MDGLWYWLYLAPQGGINTRFRSIMFYNFGAVDITRWAQIVRSYSVST